MQIYNPKKVVFMKKNKILSYDFFNSFIENEFVKNTEIKRGNKKELADFINIHQTSLSQVLNGTRFFTDEQVFMLGEFLNLNEMESQYIFLLHQINITQNKQFKMRLIKRRDALKKKSLNLSSRLEKDKILSDEEKAIFYSSWYYTCIWVFISIEKGQIREDIISRFNLDKKTVNDVLEFLIMADLAYLENGRYFHKINRTHLEKTSPFLKQHHANWRIKAIQKKDHSELEDLSFTAPLSLSKKDFYFIREEMVQLIKKVSDTVTETKPEEIYCFNLDFFKI
jgi:plasmid maintenance system antidote protein VapI